MRFEKDYALDLRELEHLVTEKTKLVKLTYPLNPIGGMIDERTLRAVIDIVEKNNAFLLFDETYRDKFRDRQEIAFQ